MYKLEGKLKSKSDVKVISDKFSVQDFVLVTEDAKYPQEILFQVANTLILELKEYSVNEIIEVTFDIRGKAYKDKYYNTLHVISMVSKLF